MNKKIELFPNLATFLDNYENNIVHFTTCNIGGVELTKNLSKSCEINNIDLLFFAPDQHSLDEMSRHTTTINNIANNDFRLDICREIPAEHKVFGSEDFISVAWMRYEILKAIINSGRIAIYLDTDIVVRKNYEADILSYLQPSIGNEGVIQQNNKGFLCTGFFAFCPSANNKLQEIYSETFLSQNNYKDFGTGTLYDQDFFNKIICPTNSNQLLRMQKLSRDLYPNGAYWYANSSEIENISKIVHYNSIKGQNLKILTMKKYGDWLI